MRLYYANRPEALYAYVNTHNEATVCLPGIEQVRLHSSFVVFYFVFVL